MINDKNKIQTVGRRKSSVSRVVFNKGNGKIIINKTKQNLNEYFKRESLVMELKEPLSLVDFDNKFDITINVKGGGLSSQARATRLAISRSLGDRNCPSDASANGIVGPNFIAVIPLSRSLLTYSMNLE